MSRRSDAPTAAPRWARSLLATLAPSGRAEEVVGDLEEVHAERVRQRGRAAAALLTGVETLDVAAALLRDRWHRRDAVGGARRAGRGEVPTASWLDFKLGLRMVGRHPSLTAVAVVAMAFGIATGAGIMQFVTELLVLPLPYADAGRIVTLQNVSTTTTFAEPRALHDFAAWREQLRTVEHLSALHLRDRNLSVGAAAAAPVAETAVSAHAFDLLRVQPLLGRPLVAADEAPGAPPVAVIAYELWQSRFAGDPRVVGRIVRLGREQTTVVGVMPPSFAFFVPRKGSTTPPTQDLWVPFRLRALDHPVGGGPAITVFGRLARGATADAARAELATVAARAAVAWPATHERLAPRVLSFDRRIADLGLAESGALTLSALFLGLLMVVVCGNVALLLFARAATREGEIAVRSALGASRGRIVAQLFAEALVLSAIAVVLGLAGAAAGLRWGVGVLREMMASQGMALSPWVDDRLAPGTIGYAAVLAVVGAVVAGVLPGLKVTGPRGQVSLQRIAGRGAGVRIGGIWTGVIITQVALTVTFVPIAVVYGLQTWRTRAMDHALPSADYLALRVEPEADAVAAPGAEVDGASDGAGDARRARFAEAWRALEQRLEAEPGVVAVTAADQLPGGWHQRPAVQVEPTATSATSADAVWRQVQVAAVDPDFFAVLGAPLLAGRAFAIADVDGASHALVANESFVRELLGGGNAIGRRVRFGGPAAADGAGPWHTIVGVVRDQAMTIDPTLPHGAGLYRPLVPEAAGHVRLAVRVAGDPAALAGRLHEAAAEVAPTLRVGRPLPLRFAARSTLLAYDSSFRLVVLAGAMALLLTNAGIYAIISFAVSRRTREIGVRVALGAAPRRIVTAVLSRTARHVGIGVMVGAGLGTLATAAIQEGAWRPSAVQVGGLLLAYMAVMMGVCLLACIVPLRRALRIEPAEALAAEI